MDTFARLRQLKKDITTLKESKLTHNLKLFEAVDELFKIIDEQRVLSDKRHNELLDALISLGAKIEKSSFVSISETQISRPKLADSYKSELMFIPDVEISGSVVRIKESNNEVHESVLDSVSALDEALGG